MRGRGVLASLFLLIFLLGYLETSHGATYNYSAQTVIEGLKLAFQRGKPLLLRAGVQGLAIYLASEIIQANSEYKDLTAGDIPLCTSGGLSQCATWGNSSVLYIADCSTPVVNYSLNSSGSYTLYVPCTQQSVSSGTYLCTVGTGYYPPLNIYSVSCTSGYYFRFFDVEAYLSPQCSFSQVGVANVSCEGLGSTYVYWIGCQNVDFSGAVPSCSKLGGNGGSSFIDTQRCFV